MVTSPKVVLITGCSKGGIGFSLCEEFASQGCKVYATARKLESMEGFAHENIEQLKLDVTSDEDVHEVISTVIEREGRIDVVVNNAGAACMGPLIDISMDDIRRTYETNTFSIIRMAKAIIPYMAARKSGTIVNIGSVVGETPTPWSGVYASTKSAWSSSVRAL
ncbi:NADPH-dependent 1-acyldihydroxyacetone phosphate reductase [Grifola frondosa]|uniref:NADPH-dependent 1-acyldihydroxyacetone phosphate reductase n=1 Tax=Grifola frondosa TaxID=5627 RepID=A0A1C7MPA1_GRIFR|nr:NADPH-dependent 1-acyldihydroxyacetone phosphate reductase [Grifola frondosa]